VQLVLRGAGSTIARMSETIRLCSNEGPAIAKISPAQYSCLTSGIASTAK
jgi:hypothetical protein